MTLRRGLVPAFVLSTALVGCGSPSCPAGESTQDTVIDDARCSGSVSATASLDLPSTIPAQCTPDPSSTCALVNDCLETASACSRICLQIDPLSLDLGLTGLPFSGPVTLPDPRVQAAMSGAPVSITSGTVSETQKGSSLTASFSMDVDVPDGGTIEITSGSYSVTARHEARCQPDN